jgi:hypothetical protein
VTVASDNSDDRVIPAEDRVARYKNDLFRYGLRDESAVERIAVNERQGAGGKAVLASKLQILGDAASP